MNILRFRRYDILVSLGCLALMGSFAWYAFKGPRGYDYREGLAQQLVELEQEQTKFASEKTQIEKRVSLMRPEHVDRDILEQLARTELNLAMPNELIVTTKD
jgi:cell division protein FtsB